MAKDSMTDAASKDPAWQPTAVKVLAALFILSLPFKFATVHIAAVLLAATLFTARMHEFKATPARLYLQTSLAWLVPILVASVWHSLATLPVNPNLAEAAKAVARILFLGLAWIVLLERGWLSVRLAVTMAALAIFAVIVTGYYDLYTHWSAGKTPSWNRRISGAIHHPNALGLFMALGIVLSAALLRAKRGGLWPWLIIILALPILWATGSRGSLIGTVAGLLCLLTYSSLRHIALLVTAGAAIWAAQALDIIDFQRAGSDVTRRALVELAFQKWQEAPWFGWGIGTFPSLEGNRWKTFVHNVPLELAVSVGVFAVIGWAYATFRLLLGLVRELRDDTRSVLAIFVTLIVTGLVDYSLLTSSLYQALWALLTLHACWVIHLKRAPQQPA